jgi:hypothetical protein
MIGRFRPGTRRPANSGLCGFGPLAPGAETRAGRPGVGPAGCGWIVHDRSRDPDRDFRVGRSFPAVRHAPGCPASWSACSGRSCTRRRSRRYADRCGPVDAGRSGSRCGSWFLLGFWPALRRSPLSLAVRPSLAYWRKALSCLLRQVLVGPETGLPGLSAPRLAWRRLPHRSLALGSSDFPAPPASARQLPAGPPGRPR